MTSLESDDRKPTKTPGSANEPAPFTASDSTTPASTGTTQADTTVTRTAADALVFPSSLREEQYQAAQKFVDVLLTDRTTSKKEDKDEPLLHTVEIANYEAATSRPEVKAQVGEITKSGNSQLLRSANVNDEQLIAKIKSSAVTESTPIGTVRPTPRIVSNEESLVKDIKAGSMGAGPKAPFEIRAVVEPNLVPAEVVRRSEGRVAGAMISSEPAVSNIDLMQMRTLDLRRGDSLVKDPGFSKTPLFDAYPPGRNARSVAENMFHVDKSYKVPDVPPTAFKDKPAFVQAYKPEQPPYTVPDGAIKVASGVIVTDTKAGVVGAIGSLKPFTEVRPVPDFTQPIVGEKAPIGSTYKEPAVGDKVVPKIPADHRVSAPEYRAPINIGEINKVVAGSEYKPPVAGRAPVESVPIARPAGVEQIGSTPIARPIEQINNAPSLIGNGYIKTPIEGSAVRIPNTVVTGPEFVGKAEPIVSVGRVEPIITAGMVNRQEHPNFVSQQQLREPAASSQLGQAVNRVDASLVNRSEISKADLMGSSVGYKPEINKALIADPVPRGTEYNPKLTLMGSGAFEGTPKYPIKSADQINTIPVKVGSEIAVGNRGVAADPQMIKQIRMTETSPISDIKIKMAGSGIMDDGRRSGLGNFENAKAMHNTAMQVPDRFTDLPSKPGLIYPKPIEGAPLFKDPLAPPNKQDFVAKPFTTPEVVTTKPAPGVEAIGISRVPPQAGDANPGLINKLNPGEVGTPIFGNDGRPIQSKPAELGSMGVIQKQPGEHQGQRPPVVSGEQALTQLPPNNIKQPAPDNVSRAPGPGPATDGVISKTPLAPVTPPADGGSASKLGGTTGDVVAKPAPGTGSGTVTDGTTVRPPVTNPPATNVGRGDGAQKPPVAPPADGVKVPTPPADGTKLPTPPADGVKVQTPPADAGAKLNTPAPGKVGTETVAGGVTNRGPAVVDAGGTKPAPVVVDAGAKGTPAGADSVIKPITPAPKLDGTGRPIDTTGNVTDNTAGKNAGRNGQVSDPVTAFEQATQRIRQLSEGRIDTGIRTGAVDNVLNGKVTTVRDAGTEAGAKANAAEAAKQIQNARADVQGTARGNNAIAGADGATGAGRRAVEAQLTSFEPQGAKQIAAKIDPAGRAQMDVRDPQVRGDINAAPPAAGIGRIPLSGSVRVTDFQPGRADGQIAGVDGRVGDVGRMPGMRGFNQVGDGRTFTSHGEIRAPRGETHRYITGLELALILSIAGIAKLRGDSRNSAARLEGRTWSITRQQGKPMIYVDGRQNPFQPQRQFGKGDTGSAFRIMVSTTGDRAAKLSTRTMRSADIATKSTTDATAQGAKLNMGLLGRYHYLNYFGKNLASTNNYYGQFRTTSYTGSMGLAFVMAAAGMTRGPLGTGVEMQQGMDKLNPNMMGPADRIRMQNQNGLLTQFGRFNLDAVLGASASRDIGKNEETDKKDESLMALDDYKDFLSRLDGFSKKDEDGEDETELVNQRLTFGIENLYDLEAGEDEEVSEVDEDDDANNALSQVLRRPKWVVEAGQTLDGLAEKLFSNADLGWLIADLNRALLRETYIDNKRIVELQSRTEIELPVWQDIQKFNQARKKTWTAENLVTIVTERQVDREVVESRLGKVVGAEA